MSAKRFTLTLHYVSCRLPKWLSSRVTEDLHPRLQALFEIKRYDEGDRVVGVQFDPKEPLDIAEKLPRSKSNQVKISNLGDSGYYMYIPTESCKYFRRKKNEDTKIECLYKDGLVMLYYRPELRMRKLEAVWRQP